MGLGDGGVQLHQVLSKFRGEAGSACVPHECL